MLIQTKVLKQYLKRFENQKFVLPVKHMLSSKVKISFLVLLYGQLMQNLIASCCKNMTQQNPSTVLRHMEACYRAKRQSIRVGVLEGQDFFAGVRPSKKCTMNLIDYSSWDSNADRFDRKTLVSQSLPNVKRHLLVARKCIYWTMPLNNQFLHCHFLIVTFQRKTTAQGISKHYNCNNTTSYDLAAFVNEHCCCALFEPYNCRKCTLIIPNMWMAFAKTTMS